ncbi:hypothetical protein P5E67_00850 [Vibrio parahaemolyticus]|nr:hypothetical protein [Vibrio parahaemolyticus]
MTYTFSFSKQFAKEFANFEQDQRDKVTAFLINYQKYGLSDFSKFEGKITPSWKGEDISQDDYDFTTQNKLWHYHVGYPSYTQNHSKYKTSDWVLHFKREDPNIHLVDLYVHYRVDGSFYLPPETSLT